MKRYKSKQPFYILACSPTSPTICLQVFRGTFAQAIKRFNKKSELIFIADFYLVLCQGRENDGFPVEICRRGYMFHSAMVKQSRQ